MGGSGPSGPSRREFLQLAGGSGAGAWLALHWPAVQAATRHAAAAKASGAGFALLSAAEVAGFEAVAEQIIPTDDTPGAREAGVIHFIDQAAAGFMAGALPMLRDGLAELDRGARKGGGRAFAALGFDAQTALLKSREETPFFGTMKFLTVAGFFALPSHGGNRDFAGWNLIGLSAQHAWLPPFGHYDRKAGS